MQDCEFLKVVDSMRVRRVILYSQQCKAAVSLKLWWYCTFVDGHYASMGQCSLISDSDCHEDDDEDKHCNLESGNLH